MPYSFEWDGKKNQDNISKHNVSFEMAQDVFFDPKRLITEDSKHSTHNESRLYCIGRGEDGILTVRFTMRNGIIRIFGAGYWRQGKELYEKENNLY